MATYNKFNQFPEDLAEKVYNLQADSLKVMLSNTAPVATNALKADITEITAQNGYAAGGAVATVSSSAQTSGTYKLVLADVTFTASGGAFGPYRYVVLYDDTPVSPLKPVIAWWDYGSSISTNNGETFTVDFDGVNGVLQIV